MTDASVRRTLAILEEFFIDSHRDLTQHLVDDREGTVTLRLDPSLGEGSPCITLNAAEHLKTSGELETALWVWNEYIHAGGR
jgi:hypothetical protein